MAMSVQQREAFLAEPWVGVVAVADDAGRGPPLVPVWYHYRPGGEVTVVCVAEFPFRALPSSQSSRAILVKVWPGHSAPSRDPAWQWRPRTEALERQIYDREFWLTGLPSAGQRDRSARLLSALTRF